MEILNHDINEDIIIYIGEFEIVVGSQKSKITGVIYNDFIQKKIKIEGTCDNRIGYNFFADNEPNVSIMIPGYKEVMIKIIRLGQTTQRYHHISARVVNNIIEQVDESVDRLVLFLSNYVQGLPDVNMEFEQWHISITKRDDEKEIFNKLESMSGVGNVLTHKVVIKKKNSEIFQTNSLDLAKVIETIEWIGSFTSARYIGFTQIYGYKNESLIWVKHKSSYRHNWKKKNNWFIPHNDVFKHLLPGVYKKLHEENWSRVLKVLLSWYIEAYNDSSLIESRITSIQISLESLSWVSLIEINDLINEASFDKLNASDKLRLLLHEFRIDKEIPIIEHLDETKKIKEKFKDGPHLLTEVRNSIVHPSTKKKSKQKEKEFNNISSLTITWLLGIHYLELSILKILDYNEMYSYRLTKWREIKDVPWK